METMAWKNPLRNKGKPSQKTINPNQTKTIKATTPHQKKTPGHHPALAPRIKKGPGQQPAPQKAQATTPHQKKTPGHNPASQQAQANTPHQKKTQATTPQQKNAQSLYMRPAFVFSPFCSLAGHTFSGLNPQSATLNKYSWNC